MAEGEPAYIGIDHVQLTLPQGAEAEARRFYCELLGMSEVPKPASLRGRGGLWLSCGAQEIHLGIEEPQPESRRHPGIVVQGLGRLRERLARAGVETAVDKAPDIPGFERIHLRDPFGNRLEFLEKTG